MNSYNLSNLHKMTSLCLFLNIYFQFHNILSFKLKHFHPVVWYLFFVLYFHLSVLLFLLPISRLMTLSCQIKKESKSSPTMNHHFVESNKMKEIAIFHRAALASGLLEWKNFLNENVEIKMEEKMDTRRSQTKIRRVHVYVNVCGKLEMKIIFCSQTFHSILEFFLVDYFRKKKSFYDEFVIIALLWNETFLQAKPVITTSQFSSFFVCDNFSSSKM